MKNQNTLSQGFTLVEITIVLGILTFIIAFGLFFDFNLLKSDLLRAEQATIISSLEKARGRSMNNMFESTHGVCYIAPNYIIFRGDTCAVSGTSEVIEGNEGITVIFSPSVVVFSQLAGTTGGATIQVSDGVKSANIIINNEGTINW